jgi:hypothetical protein
MQTSCSSWTSWWLATSSRQAELGQGRWTWRCRWVASSRSLPPPCDNLAGAPRTHGLKKSGSSSACWRKKKGGEAATLLLPGRDTEDTEGEGERDGEGEAPASEEGDGESPAGTEGDRDAPAGTKGDGEGEAPAGTEGDGEALAGTEGDGEAPAGTEGDGPAPAGAEAAAGMTLEDAAEVEALLEEAVEVLDEVQAESLMEMIPSIQSADELLDIVLELIDDSGVTMVTPEPRGRRLTFSPTSPDDDKPKVKQENEDMIKALFGPETDDEEDGLFQELFGSQTEPEGPLDEEGRENIPWFRVLFNKLGWWYIY